MVPSTILLGIESSCDDTAAAVVASDESGSKVLSSVVEGQTSLHSPFGGVVPEIAARAHAERLDSCVEAAMQEADVGFTDIDAIAVTSGPGLIGGVVSGVMCAKGIAATTGLPILGINHLAGHALTPRLTHNLAFPYLMLLVSGGHCQFLIVRGAQSFTRIGGTIDDAPGEAFDKTARLLGLPQPGGPAIESAASRGNPKSFPLPRPLLDRANCDMSFSGLKTAVLRARNSCVDADGQISRSHQEDISAAFQQAVVDILHEKSRRALDHYVSEAPSKPAFAVAGGVAANGAIRAALTTLCEQRNIAFVAPPLALCTDNAAMIAHAGIEAFRSGHRDDLSLSARPRWPLDQKAVPMIGSGKKGAKA